MMVAAIATLFIIGCTQENVVVDSYTAGTGFIGNQVRFCPGSDPGNSGYDAGDTALENVQVSLHLNGFTYELVATQYTDPFGRFLFQNIPAGNYVIKVLPLSH